MKSTRIALIGHCRSDEFALRSALGGIVPDADYVMVCKSADVSTKGATADLCLVNRALVGRFSEKDGVALIESMLSTEPINSAVVLVSNYPESQEQAIQAGAQPGFGKRDLHNDEMRQAVTQALAACTQSESN